MHQTYSQSAPVVKPRNTLGSAALDCKPFKVDWGVWFNEKQLNLVACVDSVDTNLVKIACFNCRTQKYFHHEIIIQCSINPRRSRSVLLYATAYL